MKIALTKSKDWSGNAVKKAVYRCLDEIWPDLMNTPNRVLIKPNLCYYWDSSTGYTTDARVVSSIIDFVRDSCGTDIPIIVGEADASAMRTKHAFKILGYENLAQEKGVSLINLSEGRVTEVKSTVGGTSVELPVNELLLDSDLVINVPKLKYHRVQGMTCALKNMFGAISNPRKITYHRNLSRVIVGINKIVRSHLIVVDGIVALGKYPKRTCVVLAGDDALMTDSIVAKTLGYNPARIPHLSLAAKEESRHVGKIDLIEDNISLDNVSREIPMHNHLLQKFSLSVQLRMLEAYTRICGDIVPPVLDDAT